MKWLVAVLVLTAVLLSGYSLHQLADFERALQPRIRLLFSG